MTSSVLCPIDFSESSRAALRQAGAIASHCGSPLTWLAVNDPLLNEAAELTGEHAMNTSPILPPRSTPEVAGVLVSRSEISPSISVKIRDGGHVTLEGVVGWHYERIRAERAAKHLRGVRSVFNNILVSRCDRSVQSGIRSRRER